MQHLPRSLFLPTVVWILCVQPWAANAEEVPVDLNSLEEKPAAGSAEEGVEINLDDLEDGEEAAESYLPVNTDSIEPEPNPLFVLTALAVLTPIAAMLLPPRRRKKKKKATTKAPWEAVSIMPERKETAEK